MLCWIWLLNRFLISLPFPISDTDGLPWPSIIPNLPSITHNSSHHLRLAAVGVHWISRNSTWLIQMAFLVIMGCLIWIEVHIWIDYVIKTISLKITTYHVISNNGNWSPNIWIHLVIPRPYCVWYLFYVSVQVTCRIRTNITQTGMW